MNYIERVRIDKFWGDKNVDISFKKDVNFLIGVNGSGKTTIINLIAATLTANFPTIDKIDFKKIKITLRNLDDKRIKPFIEVEKKKESTTPYPDVKYRIKPNPQEGIIEYDLDDIEGGRLFRYKKDIKLYIEGNLSLFNYDLDYRLEKFINISWLSIHRVKSQYKKQEEKNYNSTIDQKIEEISNDLIKYFSVLHRRSSEEVEKFQEHIFLSLLTDETKKKIFAVLNKLDPKKEKQSLKDIFDEFNLQEEVYENKLNKHFLRFNRALSKMKDKEAINLNDINYLIGTRRIHSVVQEWNKLIKKKDEIFKYRNIFLNVVNSLLQRKKLCIDEKNELYAETKSGKRLSLNKLSSGEKQLIIILGESLLQESKPHIYIADEPELSLHIEWQEQLVKSLMSINPNLQIIFATHSPDIVSEYSEGVIKIEEHIK